MNDLREYNSESTRTTPKIRFIHKSGDFVLEGRSIPEYAAKIYHPLYLWVKKYITSPSLKTSLQLNLEYFNVATLWWIVRIIKELLKIDKPGRSLIIYLYMNNEDYDSEETSDIIEIFTSLFANSDSPGPKVTIRNRQKKEYQNPGGNSD